ncbi:MAG: hypothetical protein ACI87W_000619 [Halieaceae bacterium]|jgi:hypothetical protein
MNPEEKTTTLGPSGNRRHCFGISGSRMHRRVANQHIPGLGALSPMVLGAFGILLSTLVLVGATSPKPAVHRPQLAAFDAAACSREENNGAVGVVLGRIMRVPADPNPFRIL